MADAVWPVGLPQAPITSRYSQVPARRVVRTQMDAGQAKVRQRFTAGWETCTILLRLKRSQLELLTAFWDVTLAAGALPFTWKHHERGNPIDYRFTSEPRQNPNAPRRVGKDEAWDVEFDLETIAGTEVIGDPPDPPDPEVPMLMMAPGSDGLPWEEPLGDEVLALDLVEEAIVGVIPITTAPPTPLPIYPLFPGFGWDGVEDEIGMSDDDFAGVSIDVGGESGGGGQFTYKGGTGDTAPGGGGSATS